MGDEILFIGLAFLKRGVRGQDAGAMVSRGGVFGLLANFFSLLRFIFLSWRSVMICKTADRKKMARKVAAACRPSPRCLPSCGRRRRAAVRKRQRTSAG